MKPKKSQRSLVLRHQRLGHQGVVGNPFRRLLRSELAALVDSTHYDFYFLTDIDVPWEADDLRDRPEERDSMLAYFKAQLEAYQFPYLQLSGSTEERMDQATQILDELIRTKAR